MPVEAEKLNITHDSRALVAVRRDGLLPLSLAQSRLWLVKRQGLAKTVAPEAPFEWHLQGRLDCNALTHAIYEISQRQESLRTRFHVTDATPRQLIDCPPVQLSFLELASHDERDREEALRALRLAYLQERFDLTTGPLFWARLLLLGSDRSILFMKVHHIIYDGWSHGVFIRELNTLYAAFARGIPHSPPVPPLAVQYADFAIWQRQHLNSAHLAHQLQYWRRRLAGLQVLRLTDRRRNSLSASSGARLALAIGRELTQRLRELARHERVTLYMVLLSAFQTLLACFTGQSDVAVATPVAGRIHPKTEPIIGFFLNVLAMRSDLSADPSFRNLLQQVRQTSLDGHAHQDIPYEQLTEQLGGRPPHRFPPLCQVQFIWQNVVNSSLTLSGVTSSAVPAQRPMARFDLTLELRDEPNELPGHLHYAPDLFEAHTIERIRLHFIRILAAVAADPDRRVSELDFDSLQEYRAAI